MGEHGGEASGGRGGPYTNTTSVSSVEVPVTSLQCVGEGRSEHMLSAYVGAAVTDNR